ncbi:hypothetical protein C7379_1202 [Hallella colorans]|uniref:Uncharacterized protein n=1 Tax=Hallella colorans TaxID=1703337 RepID=A0A2U0U069_9BACT|nr:hypothetical protein C7379_1202 [Hallella colorans]
MVNLAYTILEEGLRLFLLNNSNRIDLYNLLQD